MAGTGRSGEEDEERSLLEDSSSGDVDRDRPENRGGNPKTWVGAGAVGILGILAWL